MATIEDYELMQTLGTGGHGTVWLARERSGQGREVAIKRIGTSRLDAVARLEREAVLLSHLEHPAIVRLHDVVRDGEGFALVTELARGGSLAARRAVGPLTGSEAVGLVIEAADAVGSAHVAGVVHGDLKPSNILLSTQGRALVADFGVARWLGDRTGPGGGLVERSSGSAGGSGSAGTVSGAPGYAAPEVMAGTRPGPFSDVYSLAATLVALVGIGPPRKATDALDLPVSPALASVLAAALAGTASRRYPNAATLASALSATPEARDGRPRARAAVGSPARRPGISSESPPAAAALSQRHRSWRRTAIVVVAAVAGATLAWLVVDRATRAPSAQDGQVAPAAALHS